MSRVPSLDELRAVCRFQAFRGPGPGGQKRNKTSNAVRVVHPASGLSVVARESRSQATNRGRALARLQMVIAVRLRQPVEAGPAGTMARLTAALPDGLGHARRKDPMYPQLVADVLDVLHAEGWSLRDAASALSTNTATLSSFLCDDATVRAEVNLRRSEVGMPPLRTDH